MWRRVLKESEGRRGLETVKLWVNWFRLIGLLHDAAKLWGPALHVLFISYADLHRLVWSDDILWKYCGAFVCKFLVDDLLLYVENLLWDFNSLYVYMGQRVRSEAKG